MTPVYSEEDSILFCRESQYILVRDGLVCLFCFLAGQNIMT